MKKLQVVINELKNHFSNLNYNLIKKTDYFFKSWSNKNITIHEGGAVRVDYASFRNIFEKYTRT